MKEDKFKEKFPGEEQLRMQLDQDAREIVQEIFKLLMGKPLDRIAKQSPNSYKLSFVTLMTVHISEIFISTIVDNYAADDTNILEHVEDQMDCMILKLRKQMSELKAKRK